MQVSNKFYKLILNFLRLFSNDFYYLDEIRLLLINRCTCFLMLDNGSHKFNLIVELIEKVVLYLR